LPTADVEAWLKAVMSPLETQVREHHLQLRRRLESIKRIHHASGELEERIVELEQQEAAVKLQIKELMDEVSSVRRDRHVSGSAAAGRPTPEFAKALEK
jgi:chromosome segregation ATPase